MTEFILKRCLKDNKKGRIKAGIITAVLGVLFNILLSGLKWIAGSLSGSIAITADGFNNLADTGVCIMALLGIYLGLKTPDKKYPLGYGRLEYLSGLVISVAILFLGGSLMASSVEKIIHPAPIESSAAVIFILIASVIIKGYMYWYNSKIGKAIKSSGIKAASLDALCDSVATVAILAAIVIEQLTGFYADGYTGVMVALCILYAGIVSVKDSVRPLLGRGIGKELNEKLKTITEPYKIEKVALHDYGPSRKLLTMYLCSDISTDEITKLREHIKMELNMEAIICPCFDSVEFAAPPYGGSQ